MRERLMRAAVRGAMSTNWVVRMASRKRAEGVDATLDRQIAAVLELARMSKVPKLDSMAPDRARRFAESSASALELDPAAMAEVIDTSVGSIPVRIYVPHDAGPDWLVYFHGGGGVIGSIQSSEPVTRHLAAETRCTVASVGYRLGPEDRHPASVDDACLAWQAMVDRVPSGGRIGVAGDSFGGFLAAHIDRQMRITGERQPDVQVLIYPLVDFTLESPSIERLADGYLLTKSMMHWFRNHYLNDSDDPRAVSPWFWDDLAGSAPAIVVTAGFDPLVDEGDAWAERLRAAGTEVRHRSHPSLIHGFLSFAGAVRAARAATDLIAADFVDLLRR